MALKPGTRIRLSNQGEGWLADVADRELAAVVRDRIEGSAGDNPWYAVQFDKPIETQESGASTPSGLHLVRYTHAVVGARWAGVEIAAEPGVSCFVRLVREGESFPAGQNEVNNLPIRLWAECSVVEGAA
jgi:hypothetical protein